MGQVSARGVRHLVVLVVATMAALAAGTSLLARFYHHEQIVRSLQHLDRGQQFLDTGRIAAAADEFRASLSLDRDNPEPARLLAQALLALGRIDEAHNYLQDLLGRYPVDGRMNRDMARVAAARNRPADARAHYQRAIYGEWPDDPLERRIDTRFELINYLRDQDEDQEVLAQLLLLAGELPPERTDQRRRLARHLVEEGQIDQAIDVLRTTAAMTPGDVPLLAQLAQAQMEAGRITEARATFRTALALEPGSRELRDQITVVNRVLALDPTLPRLRLVERTQRARAVLAAVVQQVGACEAVEPGDRAVFSESAAPLLRRGVRDAEAAEDALRLAGDIWAAVPGCHEVSPEALAITRVLQIAAPPQDTPS